MGGNQTLNIAISNLNNFAYIGVFSSGLFNDFGRGRTNAPAGPSWEEQHREALLNNPVARGFMDAQEELHQVQESIQQYVTKTLELGRVPSEEEMDSGSCGHGCGCSH